MHATNKSLTRCLGIGVGDRKSVACLMDGDRKLVFRTEVATAVKPMETLLRSQTKCRVVLEAGPQSGWISRMAHELGHEVVVADPRRLKLVTSSCKKTDRVDATTIARLGLSEVDLLGKVQHLDVQQQADLSLLRARDEPVHCRVKLVNTVRSTVKLEGQRLPTCSTACFATRVEWQIPRNLRAGLFPMLRIIRTISEKLTALGRRIERISEARYPTTKLINVVPGIGLLNAIMLVLKISDPRRFTHGRAVGAHFGLVPRKRQSGMSDPQLRITKCGDPEIRRLLVIAAHRVLGPFAEDCDLRDYDPFYVSKRRAVAGAAAST